MCDLKVLVNYNKIPWHGTLNILAPKYISDPLCTCQRESWGAAYDPQDYDKGLFDHIGDSDNSNSFCHSDISNNRNIDLLGGDSDSEFWQWRVGILKKNMSMSEFLPLPAWGSPQVSYWQVHYVINTVIETFELVHTICDKDQVCNMGDEVVKVATKLWIVLLQLPQNLQSIDTLGSFKTKLKTQLFSLCDQASWWIALGTFVFWNWWFINLIIVKSGHSLLLHVVGKHFGFSLMFMVFRLFMIWYW